jgi:MFS family permease
LWIASGLGDMALAIGALAIGTQNIELFPTETRGTSNGAVTLISVIGSIVGIQLAGHLSDPLGGIGRSIALCAAGTFIAAIFVVPFLPESNHRDLDDISPPEVAT